MTKRYTYDNKEVAIFRDGEFWLDGQIDTACNSSMICNELNEQQERIQELEEENEKHVGDGEWDIRDITYCHGKFRLEEWGERYHQFYDGDKPLEDEEVVSLLLENEQLKKENKILRCTIESNSQDDYIDYLEKQNRQLKEINTELANNDKIVFL